MSTSLLQPLTGRLRLQCTSRLNHPRISSLLRPQFTSQFHTSQTLQVIRKHGKTKKFTAPSTISITPTPTGKSATSKITQTTKQTFVPKANPTPKGDIPIINHTAERLSQLPHETLIYANGDRRLYYGCALISVLSLSWVIHMVRKNILFPDTAGLPKWAINMTYIGGVAMTGVAGLALWYPGRLVRSIKAIPRSLQTSPKNTTVDSGLVLRVERSLFPLPISRTYEFTIDELILQRPMGYGVEKEVRHYRPGFVGAVVDGPKKFIHMLRDLMDTENIIPMVAKGRKQPFLLTKAGYQWEERGVDRLIKAVRRNRYAH